MNNDTIQLSIVVPTFREAANLPILIERIQQAVESAGLTAEVVVVDDNSRDGTVECCARLARNFPVRLITRENERGLSSAVVAGMKAARGEILLVMDADLSHPPEKIPELFAALGRPEVDFVIGSRYVAGGTTASDWGLIRVLNSRIATWLARPLTAVRDPLAGFFAIRRARFLECASDLHPVGYKIGLELIVKCGCRKVIEVPIFFEDRLYGQSKLTIREQRNYLSHLGRLYRFRFPVIAQAALFAAVGTSGLAVDLGLLMLLSRVIRPEVARLPAIWGADVTWNFFWNRRVTFANQRGDGPIAEYVRFCGGCLLGAAVNWSVSVAVWGAWEGGSAVRLLGALTGSIAGVVFNFAISRRWVFRGQRAVRIVDSPTAPASTIAATIAAESSRRAAA